MANLTAAQRTAAENFRDELATKRGQLQGVLADTRERTANFELALAQAERETMQLILQIEEVLRRDTDTV